MLYCLLGILVVEQLRSYVTILPDLGPPVIWGGLISGHSHSWIILAVIVGGVVSKAQPIMTVIWGGLSGTYQTLPAVLMKPPPNHNDAEAREHPLVKDHGWTL